MPCFIGIDVGGTTTTIAVGDERRAVLAVAEQFPTRSETGPREVVRGIVEQALQAAESVGGSIGDVAAVGLATPGPATVDGVLLKTPNLKGSDWDRFPIRAELERALQIHRPGLRVHYLGDGQAAALGEYAVRSRTVLLKSASALQPSDKPLSSLFMVIVGTGLGGGAVHDGRVVRGPRGRAGHIGHTTLPAHAFRYEHDRGLRVGNAYSTAESAVSLTGLTHQLEYRLSLDQWRGHCLCQASGSIRDKAKRLRGLAADGDPLALELFDDQARALGITLLNANYLGDYDLLVIGGGVCDLAPDVRQRYLGAALDSYRQHALDGFREQVHMEFSICGDDAPVIGALACVYDGA
jgi:predicted NBD/HSP70 family sugar kinase